MHNSRVYRRRKLRRLFSIILIGLLACGSCTYMHLLQTLLYNLIYAPNRVFWMLLGFDHPWSTRRVQHD